MTALILGVDSGLDGAFVWMRGGVVLHHVLTRTLVKGGTIDMHALDGQADTEVYPPGTRCIAYLEEPFNNALSGGASTSGYTDQCKRWGRLQGWLESWGYEVRGVQAKTWQRELLDLARFEVRTEKACAPRLADGHRLTKRKSGFAFVGPTYATNFNPEFYPTRASCLKYIAEKYPAAILTTKHVLSHDTKAASIAYAREHFPGVNLVPPRCKNPHDGLADAVCIAAWASKQLNKET